MKFTTYKKIILNIVLLVALYILPLYLQSIIHGYISDVGLIEILTWVVPVIGSLIIIYINYKYIKQESNCKWLWQIFEIIGIIGLLYFGFGLFSQIVFIRCCGDWYVN